ncbi:hypothetical protein [Hymenobacter psychrophilus]|uniref:Uncharacterized protein n=1 Tax=Hymenobacter psychrophilus TaxID=651662 RepID=A0A1H3PLC5_9BACT|nr:hypothetical protein [Hymenobacter psychrophilus]SDZ01821.1 hypothetical protein SAMN04488069_1384 [Hymenobacter psychrophilus]
MAQGAAPHPDKARFTEAMGSLGKLPRYYGKVVEAQFPDVDIKKLHQAVAGRTVYWEGFYALKAVVRPQLATA